MITNDPMKMTMVKTRMMAPMASSVRPELAKRKLQPPSQSVAKMEQLDEMERLLKFSIKPSSMLSTLSNESSIPVSRLFSSDSSSADESSSPSKDASRPPNDPSPSEMLSLASLASFAKTAGEGSFDILSSDELAEKQLLSEGGLRMTMLSTNGSRIASRKERGFEVDAV